MGTFTEKLEKKPVYRWIIVSISTFAIGYQMWALVVNQPRFALFDERTVFPSWLVQGLSHLSCLAALYALTKVVRERRISDGTLMALCLCTGAIGRFSSDTVLDGLADGTSSNYPVRFVIALAFLAVGVGYLLWPTLQAYQARTRVLQ